MQLPLGTEVDSVGGLITELKGGFLSRRTVAGAVVPERDCVDVFNVDVSIGGDVGRRGVIVCGGVGERCIVSYAGGVCLEEVDIREITVLAVSTS